MNSQPFCGTNAHDISRRAFLSQSLAIGSGALLGTSGAVHALDEDSLNAALKKTGRSVILLWLAGGSSQLETWDPKPGRPTGGPFGEIPTSVPGVHISELMPKMAKRMHRTAIIRGLNTRDAGHGTGAEMMLRGRKDEAAIKYPDMGAIIAKELGRADSHVPGYVSFYSQTEGRGSGRLSPAFLGSRYAPMNLDDGSMPPNLARLEAIGDLDHRDRARLRDLLSARFSSGRETETMRSHASAYARVHGLMSCEPLFDIEQEPQWIRDQYGPSLFGQQALMARRMVEAGVPFVRVSRAWWDSHGQNFETHAEMAPELDHVMATLMDDLDQRGLLESTLVVAFGEFGRTPSINASLGRDHFADAWSAAMFGCGLQQGGAVWGKTDEDGRKVIDQEVGAGELFATILSAVGVDPLKEYHVGARPIPLVNPGILPIKALLA
jgi:hypothetical protein